MSVPNETPEILGLTLLDEPKVKQSDPTLLDLTLRTVSKRTTVKPMVSHLLKCIWGKKSFSQIKVSIIMNITIICYSIV